MQNSHKTQLYYDTVSLRKNVRNNLLNTKNFVFPGFAYDDNLPIKILKSADQQAIFAGVVYKIFMTRTRN